jgi:VanZ family protein
MPDTGTWSRLHVAVFAIALVAWTVALLIPIPHNSAKRVLGSDFGLFLFAKSLHVATYAAITLIGATARAFGPRWWWVLPGMVFHGGLTEFLQMFVDRGARLEDVGLDSIGVAIGGSITLLIRRMSRPPAIPPNPE